MSGFPNRSPAPGQPACPDEFDRELAARLQEVRNRGLYRELRRVDSPQGRHLEFAGRRLLNFSSNDYLGLANEPALKTAAIRAIDSFGAGAGASRLISGSLAPCHELEAELAAFKGAESALTFATGYTTALGVIGALLGKDDVIVIDRLVHASLVDAARLCGATLRVFKHNDLNDLERILKWADGNRPRKTAGHRRRVLIVTESVFSMDGDLAPLRELIELKEQHGAWLMVDEAHATGLYGRCGRGLADAHRISERIEIQMGTLGKALGAAGGYICGSRRLVDYLVNRARTFIFSTAPVPAAAAAAAAGVRLAQSPAGEERRRQLWERVAQFTGKTGCCSSRTVENPADAPVIADASAIVPVRIGDETAAVEAAACLREQGIFVPAIRYPTVARGAARLRVTLTAAHTPEDIKTLAGALAALPAAVKKEDTRQ